MIALVMNDNNMMVMLSYQGGLGGVEEVWGSVEEVFVA
jgi:hypothetical protein